MVRLIWISIIILPQIALYGGLVRAAVFPTHGQKPTLGCI